MTRRTGLMAVLAAGVSMTGAPPAMAQQPAVPTGCSASQLHLDIDQTPSLVRMGDVIKYSLFIDNVGQNACNVHNVNVTLQTPGRDGAPSTAPESKATFQTFNAQYPMVPLGIPKLVLGPYDYTVAVDAGVSVLRARTAVDNAQLQDIARSPVNINKEISAVLFTPSITIDKVGSITGPAPAPQAVTYTFYVRNGSNPALDPSATALSNVSVTDDKCGNPTYARGDANVNGRLEVSETWEFQCTLTHPAPGTYTNVARANGENILNNRPVPVQSPPDNWTVVLVPPPANPPAPARPQGNVLPVGVTQQPGPCRLSTARSLSVRAGELNRIRVTARTEEGPVANRLVRITLPGNRVVQERTNRSGVATFNVRPTRSGRATIRAGECTTVRVSVRPARRVGARRVPRVTG